MTAKHSSKDELSTSILALENALQRKKDAFEDELIFAGISKSFEVCFEYLWKHIKMNLDKEGVESYSPREAIKHAGRLNWIENVEQWMDFLDARNFSVHGYYGITRENYITTIELFLRKVKTLRLP